jgi:small subunit ribosomal protein S7
MSRKGRIKKRITPPDPVYNSVLVSRLINQSMRDGKKSVTQKQIYQALEIVKQKTKKDPLVIFEQALDNIKPKVEVRTRRIGGASYQVPTPVTGARQLSLAIRWLVNFSRQKPNRQYKNFAQKLASEIIDTQKNEGLTIQKRQEIEKIAEANKAFAHLRW